MPLLAFFSVLVLALSASATPSEDFKTIQTAVMTSALAADLNSGKPSNEMRESLLAAASPSDQQNIKSMLSRWKKPTDVRYEAQFDHLVIFTIENEEVFRIFPKPNSSGAYYINGREWTIPADRNSYKSLNQFFNSQRSHSASRSAKSLFDVFQTLISPVHATSKDLRSKALSAAFYYSVGQSKLGSFNGEEAKTQLMIQNPSEKLLRSSGGIFRKTWDAVAGKPKDVQCTPTGAKGRILIDKEPLEFQTTNDGRVIFRMFDEKRTTFQAKPELSRFYEQEAIALRNALERHKSHKEGHIAPLARDFCSYPLYAQIPNITKFCQNPTVQEFNKKYLNDEEYRTLATLIEKSEIVEALAAQESGPALVHGQVRFSECQDAACTSMKAAKSPEQSMSQWIGENDPVPVGLALNHVPREQRDLGYVIDFDCPKDTKCKNLVLKNPERMNAKSLAEAHLVLSAARDYYKKTEQDHRLAAMSLAPLHGCCLDAACRNSDFGKSLRFVSADDGTSSAKPVDR